MKPVILFLFLFIGIVDLSVFAAEVKRIDISSFDGNIERFYREVANTPVIVTGVYSDNDFLKSLSLMEVEEYFKGKVIYGYQRKNDASGGIREKIPGEDFFRDLKGGASGYCVLDHAVSESPFAGKIKVPAFLDSNWLDESYGLNITLSGKGSFTPLHEDGSGEQSWMYLVAGEKKWTLYPPKCRPLVWDSLFKDFYNPRKSNLKRFPYLACAEADVLIGVARSGDLIFLPPGWIHQVETTEDSFGVGGNIVNEFQAYLSIETGLNEKSHALRHDFDLFILLKRNGYLAQTETGKSQVEKAELLVKSWLNHVRNKSDYLVQVTAGTGFPGEIGRLIK